MKHALLAMIWVISSGAVADFSHAQNAGNEYVVPDSIEDPLSYLLPDDKNELFEVHWADLLPPGEDEIIMQQYSSLFEVNIEEGSAEDIATQIGTFNTVEILDGQKVMIPGFTVPLTFGKDSESNEFLLVPYYGACLHQPPPPPNQTIHVKSENPIQIRDLSQAVWVEGYLATEASYTGLAGAAYTIKLTNFRPYEY